MSIPSERETGLLRGMNLIDARGAPLTSKRVESGAEKFDLVILGGGTGSTVAAWTFANEGQRVAVVDRKYVGGSCPNIACLPSKNIIHSAKVASYVRRSREYGIACDRFTLNMALIRERKRSMVHGLNQLYFDNYKKSGGELIFGSGRFVEPRTVEVTLSDGTSRRLRGTNVIISTGTRAAIEPIYGLVEAQPLTHIEALELDHVPEHLIVLGGGYIGTELAQAFRRFGSKVSVVERNDRLLRAEDEDVSTAISALFAEEEIKELSNVRVKNVSGKSGGSVKVAIEQEGVEKVVEGSHLLVATGRIPNTEGIGLDLAGVEVTDRGFLKVNEKLQTTAEGVWGIGEVAGSPQFTHVSLDDFRVVHSNLTGGNRTTTGRVVPYCVFTDPELAHIGLNESRAKEQGVAYRLFKIPGEAILRARTLSETRGFLKALVATDNDRILGFTMFGIAAGEVMASVQVAMIGGLPYTSLRDGIFAHPTMAEGLIPLFSSTST
jgi:pyruvate/2-oxoglutarate dehydrogenase complex dihydrolipoamide dehydrogenase (E3) component